MNKILLIIPIFMSTILSYCSNNNGHSSQPIPDDYSYGVFLGATSEDTNKLRNSKYQKLVLDIDEFSIQDIWSIADKGKEIYAYLSVGSLENYRDYYEDYRDITFMDYDNWPDERWVDVSSTAWQEHIVSEANRINHFLGPDTINGVFIDNLDVYYIASEVYLESTEEFVEGIYEGCLTIISELSKVFDSLLVNSGSTLLERMHDENNNLLNKIGGYVQECVFSNIVDYEHDIFSRQNNEDHEYYKSVIEMMSNYSDILLLEYTTDKSVISDIVEYASTYEYHYFISSHVDLKA